MKATGIVRPIDTLGRIVLPIELRRVFDLNVKDMVEIYTDDDCVIINKYEHKCTFCQSKENLVEYKGKRICEDCRKHLVEEK